MKKCAGASAPPTSRKASRISWTSARRRSRGARDSEEAPPPFRTSPRTADCAGEAGARNGQSDRVLISPTASWLGLVEPDSLEAVEQRGRVLLEALHGD